MDLEYVLTYLVSVFDECKVISESGKFLFYPEYDSNDDYINNSYDSFEVKALTVKNNTLIIVI